jgi:serine/threonine protein kinase
MSKLGLRGKGTYGAVIRPTLTMEDGFSIPNVTKVPYVNKESDDIAKVFIVSKKDSQESYMKEIEELEKIRNIDPTHSFTVPFKGADYGMNPTVDIRFNVKSEPKNIIKDIHTGLDFDYKKTYNPPLVFYQIILGDGGDELNESKDKISYSQFLVTLKNFTEGFILLHKGGLIHQDLKPPNVLIKKDKMNLIDFGLSIKTEDAYRENEDSFLDYQYVYFPPEYFLINYICNGLNEFYNLNKKEPGFPKPRLRDYYEIINYMIDNKSCDILIPILTKFKEDLNKPTDNDVKEHYDLTIVQFLSHHKLNYNKDGYFLQLSIFIQQILDQCIKNSTILIKNILYDGPMAFFNKEKAEKIDVYPFGIIIVEISKHINNKTTKMKNFINILITACLNANSDDRITFEKLKETLEDEITKNPLVVRGGEGTYNRFTLASVKSAKSAKSAKSSNNYDKLLKELKLKKSDIIDFDDIDKPFNYDKIKLIKKPRKEKIIGFDFSKVSL